MNFVQCGLGGDCAEELREKAEGTLDKEEPRPIGSVSINGSREVFILILIIGWGLNSLQWGWE